MSENRERELPQENLEARKQVGDALKNLFYVLKEHRPLPKDYEALARRFTGEVDEYVTSLIDELKKARANKK